MGCYECGAEGGNSLQLCTECIQRKKDQRSRNLRPIAEIMTPPIEDPLKLLDSIKFQILILVLLSTGIFFYCVYSAATFKSGVITGLLMVCWAISFLTWLQFWSRMLIMDAMWALGCFLLPILVYRYVFLNWSDRHIRNSFLIHVTFSILGTIIQLSIYLSKREVTEQ